MANPSNQPAVPAHEATLAREAAEQLAACLKTRARSKTVMLSDDHGRQHEVRLPISALRLLVDALREFGAGNLVTMLPMHSDLSTQEAADLLNMSRPFVVQLLERGTIPHHKVGSHRRIRVEDVVTYKNLIETERSQALDELAQQAQELRMGYE